MAVRVLFPFAGDTVLGGSHVSALKLAASLDRSCYEPHVLLHQAEGAPGAYARSLGLAVEVLEDVPLLGARRNRRPGDAGVLAYFRHSYPALRAALRRIRPDIVHTNEGRMHANWMLPARREGCRFLWHHRQDPQAFGVNMLAPLFAGHIISVSHFSKPARPLRPVAHKLSVVRSPFDFPQPAPERRACRAMLLQALGLPPEALLLGYAGNLNSRKRPLHFVEAVRAVQEALPGRPVHGLLFGRPEQPEQRLDAACEARAAALGLGGQVHLMGFRSDIAACMAGLDALLVTALSEPFGRTLIEAMFLGTPVIATRHGGNPEAITDGGTGFLVDPQDPGAFAAPVARLAADPALQERITAAARKEALSQYSTARHVAEVSGIYRRLLPQDPAGRLANA
ncbi:glycosyltransferase family 4 protein [Leisingera sp. SS27]|uniref:glycosyltransferase family 4 protein n=1 Tax=Leisingera sp. SS27 TaxID=2979462 RepID=UPI00232CDC89|nr:glycosyltransferase family 4 protein [Leisingera sp. SS27]MDC0660383.1 glycosyltransferase family 4 protein [Leisingera sp. SS27]